MKKYYETARSFDESFTRDRQISNCLYYDYVPHDYFSDYERLDSKNESELIVSFSTFLKKVI